MKTICDVAYGSHPMQRLNIYLPDADTRATFFYYHGGGLTAGTRAAAERFAEDLAAQGIATVSVEYRMYPDAKFPDFIEDAAAAIAFIKANLTAYSLSDVFFVGGSSAGGYLSMMLCFDRRYLASHGLSNGDICAYLHDAGQPTTHFNVLKERGVDSRRLIVDEASPLFFVGVEESYPPMLIINAENDMQNRIEQTYLLISTLRHFGFSDVEHVIVPETKHCQYSKMTGADGKNVFASIMLPFMDKQLQKRNAK